LYKVSLMQIFQTMQSFLTVNFSPRKIILSSFFNKGKFSIFNTEFCAFNSLTQNMRKFFLFLAQKFALLNFQTQKFFHFYFFNLKQKTI
jgi:hypothetical protein